MMTMEPRQSLPSKAEVESLARGYGMVYQDEILTFSENQEVVSSNQPKEIILTPIKIIIPKGSSSETIGRILAENGVIKDRTDFVERARERGVSVKLEAGTFELSPALTIDEIIDELLVGEGRR